MIGAAIVFVVTGVLGLFVQASLVHNTFPAAVAPDFILVLVVIIGLRHPTVPGLVGSFFLGAAADFASGQFLGPLAAGAISAFGLSVVISKKIYADKALAVMIITFLCSLAKSAVYLLLMVIYVKSLAWAAEILSGPVGKVILVEAVLSAVIGPVMLHLLSGRIAFAAAGKAQRTGSFRWTDTSKRL